VKAMVGFLGMSVGGALGWWLGAKVGFMTAFLLSVVGSGVGLYFARRWLSDFIP